jgi:hypothetical protein
VHARPISPELLVEHVAQAVERLPGDRRVAVAIDGAPPTRPGELADRLAGRLNVGGRAVVRVSARDYLRPASLRLEFGREDPDVFYTQWLDLKAIEREVLGPIAPRGSGRVLPKLWDAQADRAYRARYLELGIGGVVLLDGTFLIGAGLAFDLTVHLSMSYAALARHTAPELAWTLPAYRRYEQEADPPAYADIAVRCDDPRHPALVVRD